MQQFDPNLLNIAGQPLMQGDVTSVAVTEPGGIVAGLSNNVVDPNQPFEVTVEWKIFGGLVPLWIAALDPNGLNPWTVSIYAESIGGGQEQLVGEAQVATSAFTNGAGLLERDYTATVTVAVGNPPGGQPGLQHLRRLQAGGRRVPRQPARRPGLRPGRLQRGPDHRGREPDLTTATDSEVVPWTTT